MLGFKPKRTNLHEMYDYPRPDRNGTGTENAHADMSEQRSERASLSGRHLLKELWRPTDPTPIVQGPTGVDRCPGTTAYHRPSGSRW